MLPKARQDQLLVTDVDGELVIYDLRTRAAHSLNKTAAAVWRAADGQTSVAGLAQRIAAESGTDANEALVELAIERLKDADLLHAPESRSTLSRRQLVKRVAAASIGVVPLIRSISAPTPLMAQSGAPPTGGSGPCAGAIDGTPCDDGDACTTGEVCIGGVCVGTPVDCDDGDPCTVDYCDPNTGCYHAPAPDGTSCDPRTGRPGQCISGVCVEV